MDLAWCKKVKWGKFLDVVKFQKLTKVLCSSKGLFKVEMGEFWSRFENNEGICISIVNFSLARSNEKRISEWFNELAEGYKET